MARITTGVSAVHERLTPPPPLTAAGGAFWLRRWLILGIITTSALCVVLFVANVLRVTKLSEEISRLKKEQEKLLHQNEIYRSEIIRLQTPERITRIARTKLQMLPATQAPRTIPFPPESSR